MFDVVTIGSATRDAFFEANFKTISWPKTPSERAYVLPTGDKLEAKNVFFTIGGNAVNAAVTFARQGFQTASVAKVGCDISGEEIARRLADKGVDTKFIVRDHFRHTAFSVLLLEKGERTIIGYHGAADTFSFNDIDPNKLKGRWWYMSLAGESDKMLKSLVKFAVKNNISVAFNPSGHNIKHRREDILSSLKDISFLVVNDEEASLLTGVPWKKEKYVFRRLDKLMSPGILAVTMGSKGVVVSDGKFIYRAGIFKEKKLVDRTGSGDAFGAGFAAALIRKGISSANAGRVGPDDIAYAIRLATANATSVVERVGATEGVLTGGEFEKSRWRNLKIKITKT